MPKLKKLHRSVKPLRKVKDEPLDEDELEIRRLERLLKIDAKKGRKEAAAKLNREFEEFEGIGGGLGDFLMELDDLTQDIKSKSKAKKSKEKEQVANDDENDDGNEDDQTQESNEGPEQDNELGIDENEDSSDDDNKDDEEEEGNTNYPSEPEPMDATSTYRPVAGEDIYGRVVDPSVHSGTNTAKYVPPSKRKLAEIDDSSESVTILRRSMNGLLNRLGDQSKDSITRSLKALFDSNSLNTSNSILKECTLTVCAKSDQTMITLIPIYTAVISVLHNTVSKDVGAYLIEHLVTLLVDGLATGSLSAASEVNSISTQTSSEHKLILSKTLMNYLLILVYFYNLKVLHHQLLLDLVLLIGTSGASAVPTETATVGATEARLELVASVVEHCGFNLRRDDPSAYKDSLMRTIQQFKESSSTSDQLPVAGVDGHESESRIQYLLAVLQDACETNGKSQRVVSKHAEAVKSLRKWVGGMRGALTTGKQSVSSHAVPTGDTCLHVSLKDLQDAEKRGRWWRAGASWKGNESQASTGAAYSIKQTTTDRDPPQSSKVSSSVEPTAEEAALLKLAKKLRFNTATRRNVFMVVMSSRDVNDAFERLIRLEMRGKEDREIVRVLLECCAQEAKYNAFYAELNVILCNFNRQFKTTSQYAFWDFFKTLESGEETPSRRVVNLARYLSHLLCSFDIPMAILKRVDISSLSDNMILFLRTLFLALFSAQVDEDSFEKIFDRIATSNDCLAVRDTIMYFLQTYMKTAPIVEVPAGVDPAAPKKRHKLVMRILMSMDVLSIAKAQSEERNG